MRLLAEKLWVFFLIKRHSFQRAISIIIDILLKLSRVLIQNISLLLCNLHPFLILYKNAKIILSTWNWYRGING